MLSFASDADIPPGFTAEGEACSVAPAEGDTGGDGALGFHDWNPAGLGRGAGAGAGAADVADFSNAAILSRSEPGFGFAGGGD